MALASLKKLIEQQCFSSFRNQKKQHLVFYKIFEVLYKMETLKIMNLLNDYSSNKNLNFLQKTVFINSQTAKDKYNQNNSIKCET